MVCMEAPGPPTEFGSCTKPSLVNGFLFLLLSKQTLCQVSHCLFADVCNFFFLVLAPSMRQSIAGIHVPMYV